MGAGGSLAARERGDTLCNTLPQPPLGRGEERAFGCPSRGFLAGRTPKSSASEGREPRLVVAAQSDPFLLRGCSAVASGT